MEKVQLQKATPERVERAIQAAGLRYATFPEGGFLLPYSKYSIAIDPRGDEDYPVWVAIALWSRELDISYTPQVRNVIQRESAMKFSPKVTMQVNDEGMVTLQAVWAFNWGVGATDSQIEKELVTVLVSIGRTFAELNDDFPDPWTKQAE